MKFAVFMLFPTFLIIFSQIFPSFIDLPLLHLSLPASGLQEVILKKGEGQKLGLSIRGGGKGSKGNPLDPNDEGIFISKVSQSLYQNNSWFLLLLN